MHNAHKFIYVCAYLSVLYFCWCYYIHINYIHQRRSSICASLFVRKNFNKMDKIKQKKHYFCTCKMSILLLLNLKISLFTDN